MTGSFVVRRRSHRIFALLDASTLRAAAIDVAAMVLGDALHPPLLHFTPLNTGVRPRIYSVHLA